MCGIAGVVAWEAGAGAAPAVAAALDAALAHRGPDGAGTYRDGPALLVHRRLAIIDPTEAGRQPMSTSDRRYTLVFNGEVYNYRELRRTLAAEGVTFSSASDTEVLLCLLARHGVEALARVRGMFALALWDGRDRRLTLARNRFGLKPLYVAEGGGRVAFASEVAALCRAGLVAREVSPAGVLGYLAWGTIPGPLSWLRGVEPLEPGTWASWEHDGCRRRGVFADLRDLYRPDGTVGEAELRDRAQAAVAASIEAHLVADVPVGVFLSGGVDSGAIVSVASGLGGPPLHTFTVAGDADSRPETVSARRVAARFGTAHHEITLGADALVRELPAIVARLDAPTLDGVNGYVVSRAVAATGVKAVLSGVGGDEAFGGYPSFRRLPRALRASRMSRAVLPLGGALAARLPDWRARKWAHFAATPGPWSAWRAGRGLFMPAEWPALLGPVFDGIAGDEARAALGHAERAWADGVPGEAPVATAARLETTFYMRHQLLRDLDAVSMAHGLEVRTPFADHELVGALWPAVSAHPDLLAGKALLWQTLARPLPGDVTGAPKRGFTLPFDAWMRGPLDGDVRDGLAALAGGGWVQPRAVEAIHAAWLRRRGHWSRVWSLAVLGRFLEAAP